MIRYSTRAKRVDLELWTEGHRLKHECAQKSVGDLFARRPLVISGGRLELYSLGTRTNQPR